MRFIRKNGRVIPIRDENDPTTRERAGSAAISAGAAAGAIGLVSRGEAGAARVNSFRYGNSAIRQASIAKAAKAAGRMSTYEHFKDAARSMAKSSLRAGAASNSLRKIGTAGILGGGALAVAGALAILSESKPKTDKQRTRLLKGPGDWK